MARAIKRSTAPFTYVLESDRQLEAAEQSRFTLKPLTADERARLLDAITTVRIHPDGGREVLDHSWRLARESVLTHLAGVENFPVGNPRSWPMGNTFKAARESYLDQLPDVAVRELYNELFERSWSGDPSGIAIDPAAPAAAASTES